MDAGFKKVGEFVHVIRFDEAARERKRADGGLEAEFAVCVQFAPFRGREDGIGEVNRDVYVACDFVQQIAEREQIIGPR